MRLPDDRNSFLLLSYSRRANWFDENHNLPLVCFHLKIRAIFQFIIAIEQATSSK